MEKLEYVIRPVGFVRSTLRTREEAPKQGTEGAPDAWLDIDPVFMEALDGLSAGQEVILLTWLDRAYRDMLKVHPRGNPDRPTRGVFSTRSPDRPNPVGLHRVEILNIEGARLRVRPLEALEGTPIVDIKSVLDQREL
jgi:tRNA-Thr(GGU) m(6)t(6)A37 methyltransferase TsaA